MTKVLQNMASLMMPYGKKLNIPRLVNYNQKADFFRKCKPVKNPFMVMRAMPDDSNDILDLMWDSYYQEEPVTAALGLGHERNCVFDNEALKILCKGVSVVAKCKYDGSLVGASLNDVVCPWDPALIEKLACSLDHKKMMQIYMFWAYLQRAPDLWRTYCQQQIFEMTHIFVRKADRKKGLARKLMEASRDLASDAGYRLVRVDCTSLHTAKICERMKMKLAHEIQFCSYLDENNKPIIKSDMSPSVRTYVCTPHAMK